MEFFGTNDDDDDVGDEGDNVQKRKGNTLR